MTVQVGQLVQLADGRQGWVHALLGNGAFQLRRLVGDGETFEESHEGHVQTVFPPADPAADERAEQAGQAGEMAADEAAAVADADAQAGQAAG